MLETRKSILMQKIRRGERLSAVNEDGVRGVVTGYTLHDYGKVVFTGYVPNDDAPTWRSANPEFWQNA